MNLNVIKGEDAKRYGELLEKEVRETIQLMIGDRVVPTTLHLKEKEYKGSD